MSRLRIGVDVGGTTIKSALVDVSTGRLASAKEVTPTPSPATMPSVVAVVCELARRQRVGCPEAAVGIGVPISVRDDGILSGPGLHPSWDGVSSQQSFAQVENVHSVVNDADAAAIAEVEHGALASVEGTAVLLTLGTGIGICLSRDGVIFPNVEIGFLPWRDGCSAEQLLGSVARERRGLDWSAWAVEFSAYLEAVFDMFQPETIVIGGGVSEIGDEFLHLLHAPCDLALAHFRGDAGIVGAAIGATSTALRRRA